MLQAKRRAVRLVTPLCKTKNNSGKINTSSQGTLLPLLVFSLRQGLMNLPQLLRAVDLDACESLIKASFSRARCILGRQVASKSKTSASSKLCTSTDPRVARSMCHGADPDETTDELDDALDVVDGKESVDHSQPPSPILAVAASISRPSRECISRITNGLSVNVFGANEASTQETRTGVPSEAAPLTTSKVASDVLVRSSNLKICTSTDPHAARSMCHGELDDALDVVDWKESVDHSQPPSPILAVAASISRPSRECISQITNGLSVTDFGANVAPLSLLSCTARLRVLPWRGHSAQQRFC